MLTLILEESFQAQIETQIMPPSKQKDSDELRGLPHYFPEVSQNLIDPMGELQISQSCYEHLQALTISDLSQLYEEAMQTGGLKLNGMSHIGRITYPRMEAALKVLPTPVVVAISLYAIPFYANVSLYHLICLRRLGDILSFNSDLRAFIIWHIEGIRDSGKEKPLRVASDYVRQHELLRDLAGKGVVATLPKPTSSRENLTVVGSEKVDPDPFAAPNEHYIFRNAETPTSFEAVSYKIENAKVLIDLTHKQAPKFAVFDKDDNLVFQQRNSKTDKSGVPVVKIDEPVVLLEGKYTPFNIFHFLFDKLPRLSLLRRHRPDVSMSVLLFRTNAYTDFFLEKMGLLSVTQKYGIEQEAVLEISELQLASTSIDQLRSPAFFGADFTRPFIRSYAGFTDKLSQHGKKIFIDRRGVTTRSVINNDALIALMLEKGYDIVDPGALSVEAQLATFKHCDTIVGVHGAGLANLAFMPAGGRVLELLPALCATQSYSLSSNALGHDYDALICEDPEVPASDIDYATWSHQALYNQRNVIVPLDALSKKLDALNK